MFIAGSRQFEKAQAGEHLAILADIIDMGLQAHTYQGKTEMKPTIKFIWLLKTVGKDGKQLQIRKKYNASSLHEQSRIYKDLKMILGYPPTPALDIESMIGLVRKLWISRETSADGTKDYANVMGYLPAQPNETVLIPPDFIREKYKTQTTAGANGQPVQTYSQPPVQYQQPGQAQPFQPAQPQQQQPQFQQPNQQPYTQQPPVQYQQPTQYNPALTPQGSDVKF